MSDQVLSTPMGWRAAFTLAALFFVAGLVVNVRGMVAGDYAWTTTQKIGVPLLVLCVVGTVTGALAAWTTKVWYDAQRNEIHQVVLFSDVARSLEPPTTVRFDYTAPAPGSTVTGTWTVLVEHPEQPTLKVATPFVGDVSDVARLLQPALARNPALAADDATRRAIEDPSVISAPKGL